MKDDVKVIRASPGHLLHVELVDGRVGVFDMRPHLDHPGLAALKDPAYFAQVRVLFGAPSWPGGEDVAPNTIAAELQLATTA
jgi:hypothetical protein